MESNQSAPVYQPHLTDRPNWLTLVCDISVALFVGCSSDCKRSDCLKLVRFKESVALHFSRVVQMVTSLDLLKLVRFKETADILFQNVFNSESTQQGGTGEDSYIHLADWDLSVAAIEKKKKKLRMRETFSSPTHYLQGELQRGGQTTRSEISAVSSTSKKRAITYFLRDLCTCYTQNTIHGVAAAKTPSTENRKSCDQ